MQKPKYGLSFSAQMLLGLAIMALCSVLSISLHRGIFHNVAWITWGLLFFCHPVYPQSWAYADPAKLKLGARIAGGIAIVWGLITRFSV